MRRGRGSPAFSFGGRGGGRYSTAEFNDSNGFGCHVVVAGDFVAIGDGNSDVNVDRVNGPTNRGFIGDVATAAASRANGPVSFSAGARTMEPPYLVFP